MALCVCVCVCVGGDFPVSFVVFESPGYLIMTRVCAAGLGDCRIGMDLEERLRDGWRLGLMIGGIGV